MSTASDERHGAYDHDDEDDIKKDAGKKAEARTDPSDPRTQGEQELPVLQVTVLDKWRACWGYLRELHHNACNVHREKTVH